MSARSLALLRVTPALGWTSIGLAAITGMIAISATALRRTGDPILEQDSVTLTTMKLTSATPIGDILPQVTDRGVRLEGSMRLPSLQGMNIAGNPFEQPALPDRKNSVSLVTGGPIVEDVDLSLPTKGFSWPIVGRTYNGLQKSSGGSHRTSQGPQGANWMSVSQPEIQLYDDVDNTKDRLYLIYGADRFIEFRRYGSSSNTFRATNGANAVAQFVAGATSEPDEYRIATPDGKEWTFFGFDGDAGAAAGQLWKVTDTAGNVSFAGDASTGSTAISNGFSSGKVATIYDASDRRWTYTYSTIGGASRLTQVKAETKSSGTWSSPSGVVEVGRVNYDYISSDGDSYGDAGDLKLVTITTPLTDSGVSLVRQKYYQYWDGSYNGSTNPGYPHTLKLVLGFEGARQYDYLNSTFDQTFIGVATSTLKTYADSYYELDTNYKTSKLTCGGVSCGCSGGGSGDFLFSYGTVAYSNTSGYDTAPVSGTIVKEPTVNALTLWRTTIFDEVGQPLTEVRTDDDPAGSPTKMWVSTVARNSDGVVTKIYSPASVSSYTHSTYAVTVSSSVGHVTELIRVSSGETKNFATTHKRRVGNTGTAESVSEQTFAIHSLQQTTPIAYDVPLVRVVVDTKSVFPAGSALTTSYSYTWSSDTDTIWTSMAMASATRTYPVVSTATNGSNSADSDKRHFTKEGLVDYAKSTDGVITYSEYSNSQRVKSIEDADTSKTSMGEDFYGISAPSGFTSSGSPIHRRTLMAYDAQGRVDTVTHDWGGTSRVEKHYYSKLKDTRPVSLVYPDYEAGGTPKYYGPVSYAIQNHAGRSTTNATVALTSNESTLALTSHVDETQDNPIDAMALGTIVSMTNVNYNSVGVQSQYAELSTSVPFAWHGSSGTNYDVDAQTTYDAMGRAYRALDATGTIRSTVFDLNSRVSERWIGTDDSGGGGNNMVKVEASVYDGGSDMENGLLTQQTLYIEGSTTGQRVTSYLYDDHNHLIVTINPTAPHEVRKVDRLGRVTAVGLYSSSSGLSATTDPTSTTTNRMALTETSYDEQGRVWKTVRHKIDASDGSDDDTLETLTWYDSEGRVIKVKGSEFTKMFYDRLGRQTHQFVLASSDDSAYSDADDVSGDVVLEESQTTYDTPKNDVIMQATIQRHSTDFSNNNTHTLAALDTNADSDRLKYTAANLKGRIQITANWYDRFGRLTDTVAYGDNGGSDLDRSGLSAPSSADNTPRISYSYDTAGRLKDVTDPKGKITRSEYDSEGHKTKEIRNYDDGTPSGDGSGGSPVNDVTTLWAYTNGLMTSMTADLPAGQTDQVTTYTYGTTKGASAGDSKIATGHLLQKVTYPDDAVGDRGYVLYAYNAQSQLIWTEDQATNVVENVYDTSGRETSRAVTTLAGGFDGAVRRIERAYDTLGRASTVTQYDAASSGSVTDEVKYSYDDWGNLSKFQQDRNSTVAGSGGDDYAVSYAYAKNTSGRNTLRRSSMTLPSGKQIDFSYSNNRGLLDNDASRVTSEKDGAVFLATFAYNGVGSVVYTTFPEPQVTSTVRGASAGTYSGIDRFNRITESYWQKDLVSPIKFYDTNISWDRNSNVTLITDAVHHGFDVAYTNDDLNRLTKASEGTWSGSAITSKTREQEWVKLSHTGNWTEAKLDLNGDGNYTGTGEYDDNRTNNAVNEMLTRSWGGNTYTAAYNKNGDQTDDGKDYKYEWDAFNRLVRVKNQSNQLVEEYRYNGLGFRIAWHADTDADGDVDSNDKWYYPAYDEAWRMVSVFRESDSSPKEEFVAQLAGDDGYGGASLLDGVVLRYKDANTAWATASDGVLEEKTYYCQNWRGDVSALVTSGGAMVEWVKYLPYGIPFGLPAGDTNSDGDCDAGDSTQISIWYGAMPAIYDVRGDVDLDGDVDTTDQAALVTKTLGWALLSGVGNRTGYCGAMRDASIEVVWNMRVRSLNSSTGTWSSRDRIDVGYFPNFYFAFGNSPINHTDPFGLAPAIQFGTWACNNSGQCDAGMLHWNKAPAVGLVPKYVLYYDGTASCVGGSCASQGNLPCTFTLDGKLKIVDTATGAGVSTDPNWFPPTSGLSQTIWHAMVGKPKPTLRFLKYDCDPSGPHKLMEMTLGKGQVIDFHTLPGGNKVACGSCEQWYFEAESPGIPTWYGTTTFRAYHLFVMKCNACGSSATSAPSGGVDVPFDGGGSVPTGPPASEPNPGISTGPISGPSGPGQSPSGPTTPVIHSPSSVEVASH